MDTINESSTAERLEVGRAILRQSLNQIVADIETTAGDAALRYPVHLSIPNSRDALATIVTSAYPPNNDWEKATMIFLEIIGGPLGGVGLRSRDRKIRRDWCRRS
jgi:hypothetical protein